MASRLLNYIGHMLAIGMGPLALASRIPVTDVNRYVAAVAASEMPLSFPKEARIAQEIAARSYYIANGAPKIVNTTDLFQVLKPSVKSMGLASMKPNLIIQFLRKGVIPEYHAACPGYVFDPASGEQLQCPLHSKKPRLWTVKLPANSPAVAAAKQLVQSNDLQTRRSLRLQHRQHLLSPFVTDIIALGDQVLIRGSGHGHGVGMCQWGAKYLAEKGLGHEAILRTYYGQRWTWRQL